MDSVFIVYTPDWEGIEIYFDELSAYKAAVKSKSDVIQVGEGSIKEQVKNPRKFDNQPKENTHAPTKKDSHRNNRAQTEQQSTGDGTRQPQRQGSTGRVDQTTTSQAVDTTPQTPHNPLEDRPADLAAVFNDIDFSGRGKGNIKPPS